MLTYIKVSAKSEPSLEGGSDPCPGEKTAPSRPRDAERRGSGSNSCGWLRNRGNRDRPALRGLGQAQPTLRAIGKPDKTPDFGTPRPRRWVKARARAGQSEAGEGCATGANGPDNGPPVRPTAKRRRRNAKGP